MSDVAVEYIELGLRLGRHVDGLSTRLRPATVKVALMRGAARPTARSPRTPHAPRISRRPGGPSAQWLEGNFRPRDFAQKLARDRPFEDEVEQLRNSPDQDAESDFEQAHRDLDAVLPGSGSLEERYRAWREEDAIPASAWPSGPALAAELSGRTLRCRGATRWGSGRFEYMGDKPWAAFNYYLGGLRSRVSVNTISE
jgi:hypothetical protein